MEKYLTTIKNSIRKIASIAVLNILIAPMAAYAQGTSTELQNPISSASFEELLENILNMLLAFGIPLYGVMIGYAALVFILGSGAPDKRKKALNIFKYATIGFIIILLGKAIVAIVRSLL